MDDATKLMRTEDVLALLPIGEKQLRNLINHKGLPCSGEGRRRTYVWPDVLEWWVAYRMDLEMRGGNAGTPDADFDDAISENDADRPRGKEDIRAANLRKTRADADLRELALSQKRGEVVTIADVKTRLDRVLGNLRTRLLTIAPKLSTRLAGLRDRNETEAAIKDEMETLCRELATGAVVDLPAEFASGGIVEDGLSVLVGENVTDDVIPKRTAEKLKQSRDSDISESLAIDISAAAEDLGYTEADRARANRSLKSVYARLT
jgi:phage terminase Nu1 subunit (DNA packaging protein)